jgi:hypothetical protein
MGWAEKRTEEYKQGQMPAHTQNMVIIHTPSLLGKERILRPLFTPSFDLPVSSSKGE